MKVQKAIYLVETFTGDSGFILKNPSWMSRLSWLCLSKQGMDLCTQVPYYHILSGEKSFFTLVFSSKKREIIQDTRFFTYFEDLFKGKLYFRAVKMM